MELTNHTKQDFLDEFTQQLICVKAQLIRCELELEKALNEFKMAQKLFYKDGFEAVYPNGRVDVHDAKARLLILLSEIESMNGLFVSGKLAELIDDSGHDPVPF